MLINHYTNKLQIFSKRLVFQNGVPPAPDLAPDPADPAPDGAPDGTINVKLMEIVGEPTSKVDKSIARDLRTAEGVIKIYGKNNPKSKPLEKAVNDYNKVKNTTDSSKEFMEANLVTTLHAIPDPLLKRVHKIEKGEDIKDARLAIKLDKRLYNLDKDNPKNNKTDIDNDKKALKDAENRLAQLTTPPIRLKSDRITAKTPEEQVYNEAGKRVTYLLDNNPNSPLLEPLMNKRDQLQQALRNSSDSDVYQIAQNLYLTLHPDNTPRQAVAAANPTANPTAKPAGKPAAAPSAREKAKIINHDRVKRLADAYISNNPGQKKFTIHDDVNDQDYTVNILPGSSNGRAVVYSIKRISKNEHA